MIRLTNSATRKKDDFRPLDPGNVRMYVCGPTVYDRAHLGNARPAVVFDVLYRLLRHTYGEGAVTYVRNITDVDDKINDRAAQSGRTIREITEETVGWYHEDMDALGVLRPTHEPRATEYIPQMVSMIEALIRKGYAYSRPISFGHNSRAVYFNSVKAPEHTFFAVERAENYGSLSGRSLDEMISGAKAEVGEGKKNPMDFVLWKPSRVGEPGWESPWGLGRPGWHIECSAMAKSLLGAVFDIHGGGIDLQFPHHENEIAQSCCANGTALMAQVWLHNEMLLVEGKKMSKSLGNFFTVRELLDKGWPGEVIRFVLLSTHYRSPMDWTEEKARQAARTLRKWRTLCHNANPDQSVPEEVRSALTDDINIHLAISHLHKLARRGNAGALLSGARFLGLLTLELGSWFTFGESSVSEDLRIDEIQNVRAWARRNRDYEASDRLRNLLYNVGVGSMDKDGKSVGWFEPDFLFRHLQSEAWAAFRNNEMDRARLLVDEMRLAGAEIHFGSDGPSAMQVLDEGAAVRFFESRIGTVLAEARSVQSKLEGSS
jgi:cysteinyl-tRNA synthetase